MSVSCASCGSEQPESSRFCGICGAALFGTCPSCGAEHAASAAFCAACGFALRAGSARAAAGDDRQERRVVTILFADLAGSTSLGERLDPEDVRDLQSSLFGLINEEVERFGGLTEKFVGDAVLAVFGLPRVHEDDAERAVRAALATQARFVTFAEGVEARFGGEVGLRIGVNTGEVVSGREAAARGELMVSGDAVNVAARLQQAARPGEVLVGERTRAATSRAIRYEVADPVAAKGKAEPLGVARAIAPSDPVPSRGTAAFAAPLVGRQDELAILAALARRVERERAPQLVTLYGSAGVGKSRLLAEFLDRLSGVTVLRGRCLPYGDGITYWPFGEAVKAQAGVLETDSAAAAAEKLRRTVSDVVSADDDSVLTPILWTIGLALPTGGANGEGVAQTLHEAWRVYLSALGRRQATVLVVEDIHWASAPMLDLLERLADSLVDTSILIACTARTELLEVRPSWGAAKQNATALTLSPLGSEQSSQLVEALLGEKTTDAVRDGILARAEGNPFFVEEMLRMLVETGELVNSPRGWELAFERSRLPDSVHGVIAARLDLLDADERDALRRCSVVGRFFWPAAVGVPDETISALGARGLVAEKTSTMAETREFAFKHALTRDVAYASLPRAERRALHTRVAEWLEELAPDRGIENAELVAYHYGEAVTHGGQDGVVRRAASQYVVAGEAALSRGAFEIARQHFERAASLRGSDTAHAEALLGLARLEVMTGGDVDADVGTSVRRALDRLDEAGSLRIPESEPVAGELLALRSRALWLLGRWDDAMAAADEAVRVLRLLPESAALARALARRSQLAMLRSEDRAEELCLEALEVGARVGDPLATINARINLVTYRANTCGVAPDPGEMLDLIEVARGSGSTEEARRGLVNFIWSASGYLPVDEILATLEQGKELLAGAPVPAGLHAYLPVSVAVLQLLPAGRWSEIDAELALIDEDGLTPTNRMPWLGLTAQLALRRGDVETAGDRAREQHGLATRSGEPQRLVPMACAFLPWAHVAGESEQLVEVAAEVLELVAGRWSGLTALPAVRAIAAAGEVDLLARWADSLATAKLNGRIGTSANTAAGLVALHEGRTVKAFDLLDASARRDRALGYDVDAALADLDAASALEALGDAERAQAVRARSDELLASLGCVHRL